MSFTEVKNLDDLYIMPTYARKQVEFVSGLAMTLRDSNDKTYLDFIAGVGAASTGHCHPHVSSAVEAQAQTLVHTSNYYYSQTRSWVARALSNLLENSCLDNAENSSDNSACEQVWKTFFSNSGAEANECAIKLARLHGKQVKAGANLIVTLEKSFHGRTLAALAATGQPGKQELFKPLPQGFVHTPINDVAALQSLFANRGDEICAVMIECIQGESGVHPCSFEFIDVIRALCTENDALFIVDEVQTGMFRCGENAFAFQNYKTRPDVVTIAKGVASGYPTGMCCASGAYGDVLGPGDHGSTFGGSQIATAAAKATIEVLVKEKLGENSSEVGAYFKEKLQSIPQISQVRGSGLMLGCDVTEGISAPNVLDELLNRGFVANCTGPRTLRFLPPLVCTKNHVDSMLGALSSILGQC